jgi:hypothetical protein
LGRAGRLVFISFFAGLLFGKLIELATPVEVFDEAA